jgi:hypothetical protein
MVEHDMRVVAASDGVMDIGRARAMKVDTWLPPGHRWKYPTRQKVEQLRT